MHQYFEGLNTIFGDGGFYGRAATAWKHGFFLRLCNTDVLFYKTIGPIIG